MLLCVLLVVECIACVVFTTLAAWEMTYIKQDCFTVEFIPKQVLCLWYVRMQSKEETDI